MWLTDTQRNFKYILYTFVILSQNAIKERSTFRCAVKILEENGFTKERKNLKLLEKTDGDVNAIINFYNAQKALKAVLKAEKKTIDETEETLKGLKVNAS